MSLLWLLLVTVLQNLPCNRSLELYVYRVNKRETVKFERDDYRYFIVRGVPGNFEGDDGWIFWRKRAGSIIDRETDCLQ